VSIPLLIFVPWRFALPVVAVLILIVVSQIITVRRISAVEMDPTKRRAARGAATQVAVTAEEKVLGTIVGIMRTGWIIESHGVGHIKHPHNAMVITNRNVILLFVPLPGGDLVVDGTDMNLAYWALGKKKIEDKLHQMMSSMSLQAIINSDAGNIVLPRQQLQPVKPPWKWGPFRSGYLKLISETGEKYTYMFRDLSDLDQAIQLLRT
jgi:hypothetical protein